MEKSYGSIPLGVLEKAVAQIRTNANVYNMTEEELKKIPVPFEYLIGSFFPEVLKNVQEEANKQYTKGYIDGMKAAKEE